MATATRNDHNKQVIWPWSSRLLTLAVMLAFALAYSQAALFTSNQNQYLLHGAAEAGVGSLENDWLANTADPTPVFSFLVRLTFLLRLPFLFNIYYIVLLGLYLYSIWGLLLETLKPEWTRLQSLVVFTLLIAAHSFALRFGLSRILGQEWRFILEGGVAGQRLLGTVFQPSTFGVLFLFGILLYLKGKKPSAVFSVAIAATVHPTYLLSAGLVTAGLMFDTLIEERSWRKPFRLGLLALLMVLPILLYTWINFQPTSERLTELATQILVEERIPNHILLEEWLGTPVLFQSMLVFASIAVFRQRSIARIMVVIATAIFVLTLFQFETGNQRLALLFPWRPSALLVPLASTLLIGAAADLLFSRTSNFGDSHRHPIIVSSSTIILLLAVLGVGSYIYDLRGKLSDSARPMYEFISANHNPADRFFIPPKLQDFRLATGAPILVDFKSIPYVDTEVIEWYERLRIAQNFYRDSLYESQCYQIDKAISIGAVNHAVLSADQFGLECPVFSELLFTDDSFWVYRLDIED